MKKEGKVTIYVDTREKGTDVVYILERKATLVFRTMEIGDYLVSHRVCIERKTTADFVKAIKSKRLFRQIIQLRDAFERPLLIIEGYNLYQEKGVHVAGIRGALSLIAVTHDIPILFTQDSTDTASFILTIAKQEQLQVEYPSLYPKTKAELPSQEIKRIVEAFPGVGSKLAELLLKRYKSIMRIMNAPIDELMDIPLIGEKRAKKIREILTREYR
jgi:Fanconi anemia group M protein